MDTQLNPYFNLLLIGIMIFVGLATLIGGIMKSPRPFFWLKTNSSLYLKTPHYYTAFGIVALPRSQPACPKPETCK